jgi:hypothetical protein
MRPRGRDERGVIGVWLAVLLVVLFGMLALSMDGGLMYVRFRAVRNANDAAALAAALSCARGEGLGAANAQAADYANRNATGSTPYGAGNVYTPGCTPSAGKVTVHYGATQPVYASRFLGIDSPRIVQANATAKWGAAAGATNIAPLMLSMGRLSTCDIPQAAVGTHCFFWWDNGTGNNTTVLTNAEWGLMDLNKWDVAKTASCSGNVNQSNVDTWIHTGFPGTLLLKSPPPTYVCRGSGFQGGALDNDVNDMAGKQLLFPVNDPNQQVDSAGNICKPGQSCTVDKYAIVSFGVLNISHVWTGQQAQTKCNHPAGNNGSVRCLEAVWQGPLEGGVAPGDAPSFGLVAVGLSQ